jgi:hypothetical protein
VTWDEISEEIFNTFLRGEIDRWGYYDAFNNLYDIMPDKDKAHLKRRLDNRCLGEFALSIFDYSFRESLLVKLWRKACLKKGLFTKFEYEDHGIENNGRVVIEADKGGKRGNADFIVDLDGPILSVYRQKLEIKYNPAKSKNSYKCADLRNYAQNDVLVLTIMGARKMIGPNGNPGLPSLSIDDIDPTGMRWFLLSAGNMNKMLAELPVKNLRETGFKPGVQVFEQDFDKYFNVYDF